MREIKFRVYNKLTDNIYKVKSIDWDDVGNLYHINGVTVNPVYVELMQYTGLKDNTKWDQLSEKEKIDFYKKVYSEDGLTIKYENVEDVKHLWNGKEIYEGDIVKCLEVDNTSISEYVSDVYWDNCYYGVHQSNTCDVDLGLFDSTELLYKCPITEIEVIGNIYENPELLESN